MKVYVLEGAEQLPIERILASLKNLKKESTEMPFKKYGTFTRRLLGLPPEREDRQPNREVETKAANKRARKIEKARLNQARSEIGKLRSLGIVRGKSFRETVPFPPAPRLEDWVTPMELTAEQTDTDRLIVGLDLAHGRDISGEATAAIDTTGAAVLVDGEKIIKFND